MGKAAAIRLHEKGYEVAVWNRSPGKAAELVERGASEAASIAQAVEGADVALTFLANDPAVKQVYLGEGGAIASLGEAAVLVDMSTVHPDTSRALADATPGGRFVDAPILGGPETFLNGRAKLLVGGREDVVRSLERLWIDLSDAHFYTGPNGTATTLKLLSNLILVGGTLLMAEAVVTAQASGIRNDVLREVLGASPAVSPGVKVRLDDVLEGDHHGWWTLELADKDLSLVLKLASGATLELPLAAATEAALREAIEAGYSELDLGAVTEVLRRPAEAHANSR